jgi:hypothetical protein
MERRWRAASPKTSRRKELNMIPDRMRTRESTCCAPLQAAGKVRPSARQIADRARSIWEAQGCPLGRVDENWAQAEAQLLQELNAS